ncbi:hypothetical protein ACIBCH_32365 [Amycolatopsis thailandensis]
MANGSMAAFRASPHESKPVGASHQATDESG